MKTADKFLDEAADTYRERNAVYGNNYLRVGGAMAALFPDGVFLQTADDFNRFHIFMLEVVKQSRYAVNWDKGGHADSAHDTTVYSAMLESIDAEIAARAATEALTVKYRTGEARLEPLVPPAPTGVFEQDETNEGSAGFRRARSVDPLIPRQEKRVLNPEPPERREPKYFKPDPLTPDTGE